MNLTTIIEKFNNAKVIVKKYFWWIVVGLILMFIFGLTIGSEQFETVTGIETNTFIKKVWKF